MTWRPYSPRSTPARSSNWAGRRLQRRASRLPNGGDGRYDVYVHQVGGNIGFVQTDGAVAPGSNSAFSFMGFDLNVKAQYDAVPTGPGNIRTLTRREAIQDVAAHEYFHSIQNGFNSGLGGFGLGNVKEATANWMNDEAYDDLNVNVRSEALGDFTLFRSPDVAMDAIPYGGWFWYRYLSERHGPRPCATSGTGSGWCRRRPPARRRPSRRRQRPWRTAAARCARRGPTSRASSTQRPGSRRG